LFFGLTAPTPMLIRLCYYWQLYAWLIMAWCVCWLGGWPEETAVGWTWCCNGRGATAQQVFIRQVRASWAGIRFSTAGWYFTGSEHTVFRSDWFINSIRWKQPHWAINVPMSTTKLCYIHVNMALNDVHVDCTPQQRTKLSHHADARHAAAWSARLPSDPAVPQCTAAY